MSLKYFVLKPDLICLAMFQAFAPVSAQEVSAAPNLIQEFGSLAKTRPFRDLWALALLASAMYMSDLVGDCSFA